MARVPRSDTICRFSLSFQMASYWLYFIYSSVISGTEDLCLSHQEFHTTTPCKLTMWPGFLRTTRLLISMLTMLIVRFFSRQFGLYLVLAQNLTAPFSEPPSQSRMAYHLLLSLVNIFIDPNSEEILRTSSCSYLDARLPLLPKADLDPSPSFTPWAAGYSCSSYVEVSPRQACVILLRWIKT